MFGRYLPPGWAGVVSAGGMVFGRYLPPGWAGVVRADLRLAASTCAPGFETENTAASARRPTSAGSGVRTLQTQETSLAGGALRGDSGDRRPTCARSGARTTITRKVVSRWSIQRLL